jgi:hypothetical protein
VLKYLHDAKAGLFEDSLVIEKRDRDRTDAMPDGGRRLRFACSLILRMAGSMAKATICSACLVPLVGAIGPDA